MASIFLLTKWIETNVCEWYFDDAYHAARCHMICCRLLPWMAYLWPLLLTWFNFNHHISYMRHCPISRATLNRNGLFSMFYMFTCFSYFVHWLQTLCIYVWLEAFFLIGIVTLHFSWFCTMIDGEQEEGQFFDNMAGTENDLNHVLSTFVDSEHEIPNFCNSRYVDMSELQSLFRNNGNEFLILTLNIQSVNNNMPFSLTLCHFRWHWGVQNTNYDIEINAICSVSVRI